VKLYGGRGIAPGPHGHCCQRRTTPRSEVTCKENLVKFGRVISEISERTDKQTDRQTDRDADYDTWLHSMVGVK